MPKSIRPRHSWRGFARLSSRPPVPRQLDDDPLYAEVSTDFEVAWIPRQAVHSLLTAILIQFPGLDFSRLKSGTVRAPARPAELDGIARKILYPQK
jgi:hypothetical protein